MPSVKGVLGYHGKPVREASQADEALPRKETGQSLGLNSHGLCACVFNGFDGKIQASEPRKLRLLVHFNHPSNSR